MSIWLNCAAISLALLGGSAPLYQGAPPARRSPHFEVVSIKEVSPNQVTHAAGLPYIGMRDPSEWQAPQQLLQFIVMYAYGLGSFEKARIVGLPQWAHSEFFEIDARVPPHTDGAQIPSMVQAMLADRFGLQAHWETRNTKAVAITVAPGGPKMLRDSACDSAGRSPIQYHFLAETPNVPAQKDLACGTFAQSITDAMFVNVFHGFSMEQLASHYSGAGASLPVVDRTGLAGAFDFTLRLPRNTAPAPTFADLQAVREQARRDEEQAFRKQLGLDIDFSKPAMEPMRILVIDRVEQPTPN